MDKVASSIADIIKDYRNDSGIYIDTNYVLGWVNQFDENDREFLLEELHNILGKSYLSKSNTIEALNKIFEFFKEKFKYNSITEFLSHVKFLSCQGPEKSQTKLLEFLNEISLKQFGIKLEDCGKDIVKHWIYIDDVLASGGTFKREISHQIDSYGVDKFIEDKISIIPIFFFLHSWGMSVVTFGMSQKYSKKISEKLDYHYINLIENDPRINYYNPNPRFNNVYPSVNKINEDYEIYLDKLEADKHRAFAYRKDGTPVDETFYTSSDNRNRYEQIILNKGLEILAKVDTLSPPIRPLGLTYPSYQTFGTGSHAFTWRNISNTCPIVYWWENHGWHPLFPVENRGKH